MKYPGKCKSTCLSVLEADAPACTNIEQMCRR